MSGRRKGGLIITCTKILFYVSLLIGSVQGFAQDPELVQADRLAETGHTWDAITEYKRFLFFHKEDTARSEVYYRISLLHRTRGEWDHAISALRSSIESAGGDSLRDSRRLALAITLIAARRYDAALFTLTRVISFSRYHEIKTRGHLFLGVCNLYLHRWDESLTAFSMYFEDHDRKAYELIESILLAESDLPRKSPKLAKWLSTFIPGAGQVYAGNYSDGLNALILNGVIWYFLVDSIFERNFQDAFISFLPLSQRYYSGNRINAEHLAVHYNAVTNERFVKKIMHELSELEKQKFN